MFPCPPNISRIMVAPATVTLVADKTGQKPETVLAAPREFPPTKKIPFGNVIGKTIAVVVAVTPVDVDVPLPH